MKSIAALGVTALLLAQSSAAPTDTKSGDWTTREWDAIVVGAGTAGIIVADRLSEAGLSTLLLEQGVPSYGITGGRERPEWLKATNMSRVDVPGLYKSIFSGNTDLTCGPEVVSSFQACAVGGNSAINAGLYFQPPASDWDDYHPPGWHGHDVQPAVDRLIKRQPPVTQYSADGKYYLQTGSWVVNEHVGQGLFDNPNTFIQLSAPTVQSYTYSYDDPPRTDEEQFLRSRSGPYTFASQTSAFWSYIHHKDGSRTGVQGTIDSAGYADFTNNNTITLNVYGTSGMLSAGRVVLSSDGKFIAGPSSDVYYSNPRDARAIATFIHSIFQSLPPSTPDAPSKSGLTPLNIPQKSTVDEIHAYITKWSPYAVGSVQHWSSSCRLGTCVDVNTKVVGTKNVHVVDASIVSPLTVNPQFGVMVAAERAAEKILRSFGLRIGISL